MGWSAGSWLAIDIWKLVKSYIQEDQKQKIAKAIINKFKEEDADEWYGDSDLEKAAKAKKK